MTPTLADLREAAEKVRAAGHRFHSMDVDLALALLDRLEKAQGLLKPFAEVADRILSEAPAEASKWTLFHDCTGKPHSISLDHLRRTVATLKEQADDRT